MMMKRIRPVLAVLPNVSINARLRLRFAVIATAIFITGLAGTGRAENAYCPFCTAASQTLRQEIQTMDVVAIGKLISDDRSDIDGLASFEIDKVLSGETLLKPDQAIQATYFGPGKSNKRFLLMGVDPKELVWSSPLPLSAEAEDYIVKIKSLPEDPIDRLDFYQKYFEHPDSMLARDCYDEFALAPYSDVVKLKDRMNREQLLSWVQDTSRSPDRKRLYFTMLGICGNEHDAELFETMISSSNPDDRAGLDALIAAFLTLRGESGLALVEERFFRNTKTQYAEIYSAVTALRVLGTEGVAVPKEAITKAMHGLLERPDLADLVIPDLARWGDWSQLDKLCDLFEKATDDNNWVRMPIVNYVRACPLPEAKEKLKRLEEIDPAAVKRAKTFFPIPTPAPTKKGETSFVPVKPAADRALVIERLRRETRIAYLGDNSDFSVNRSDTKRFSANTTVVCDSEWLGGTSIETSGVVNPWVPMVVVLMSSIIMVIVMWTMATSSGPSLRYALAVYRK